MDTVSLVYLLSYFMVAVSLINLHFRRGEDRLYIAVCFGVAAFGQLIAIAMLLDQKRYLEVAVAVFVAGTLILATGSNLILHFRIPKTKKKKGIPSTDG